MQALAHSYLAEYSMPEDEPVANGPFIINDDHLPKRTLAQWKGLYFCSYCRSHSLLFLL